MYKRPKILTPLFVIALFLGLSLQAEAKGGTSIEGVININTATAEELTLLPGVGPARAEAIEYADSLLFNDRMRKPEALP